MNKLLLLEGLNTTQLKVLCIDDAEFLSKRSENSTVLSITQSIHKCQYVIFSEKMNPALQNLENHFMGYATKIKLL